MSRSPRLMIGQTALRRSRTSLGMPLASNWDITIVVPEKFEESEPSHAFHTAWSLLK